MDVYKESSLDREKAHIYCNKKIYISEKNIGALNYVLVTLHNPCLTDR